MDIFKLIFYHDQLLEDLSGNGDARNKVRKDMDLEDFMKPIPTYNRYYFSGTRLKENRFGLTTLEKKTEICEAIQNSLNGDTLWLGNGYIVESIERALEVKQSSVIITSQTHPYMELNTLEIDHTTGIRDRIPQIKAFLDKGVKVIYLENSHDGLDLHMFSKNNMYEALFNNLRPLVSPEFRYFSINGKRMSGERMFYFETWTIERPPHGFEEVTEHSIL